MENKEYYLRCFHSFHLKKQFGLHEAELNEALLVKFKLFLVSTDNVFD
jgi:hypothetical protein